MDCPWCEGALIVQPSGRARCVRCNVDFEVVDAEAGIVDRAVPVDELPPPRPRTDPTHTWYGMPILGAHRRPLEPPAPMGHGGKGRHGSKSSRRRKKPKPWWKPWYRRDGA